MPRARVACRLGLSLVGLFLTPTFLRGATPENLTTDKRDAAAWRRAAASLAVPQQRTEVLDLQWVQEDATPATPLTPGAALKEDGWKQVDIQAALQFLAEEARDMTLKQSLHAPPAVFEHHHMQGIRVNDQTLRLALEVLASTQVLTRCTDEQSHLAAALAIELLGDPYVAFDWSASDGAVLRVRNLALKMLESLTGKNFGELSIGGGFKPPDWDKEAAREDVKIVDAWQRWWQKSAALPRAEWLKG